jgi:putative protease
MIERIPEAVSAGVRAFKLEGRMKSAYYVGVTTRAYRQAIDTYYRSPSEYRADPARLEELKKTSNREFTTGFYLGEMQAGLTPAGGGDRITTHAFVGLVTDVSDGEARVEVRGRIRVGDEIDCIQPNGIDFQHPVESIVDEEGQEIDAAHANQIVHLPGLAPQPFSLLRRTESC